MTYVMKNNKKISGNSAKDIYYDNSNTSLESANIQDAITEINSNLNGLNFAQDAEGNWGYIPNGADTVIPFNSSSGIKEIGFLLTQIQVAAHRIIITPDKIIKSSGSGEYLKVYYSGNISYLEVIKDCNARINNGDIKQLAAGKIWSWNIIDTSYSVFVTVFGD